MSSRVVDLPENILGPYNTLNFVSPRGKATHPNLVYNHVLCLLVQSITAQHSLRLNGSHGLEGSVARPIFNI